MLPHVHSDAPLDALTNSIKYYATQPGSLSTSAAPTAPSRNGVRTLCPDNNGREYWHRRLQRPMPWMCCKVSCPVCVARVARDIGIAIAFARPSRAALLTNVPADWPEVQRRMNDVRRNLRRAGLAVRDAYHVEPNPSGVGAHIHLWMHGDLVRSTVLTEAAARAGLHCEGVDPAFLPEVDGLSSVQYGMKLAIDADDADEVSLALRDEFLRLNNGRIVHTSRGFWRDGRDGRPITGWRRAARDARSAHYDDEGVAA